MEVYVESEREAQAFCKQFIPYREQISVHQQTNALGSRLKLEGDVTKAECIHIVSSVMANVWVEGYLSEVIIRHITAYFYFSDPDEMNRIYDYSMDILFETDRDNQSLRDEVDTVKFLQHIFSQTLKEHTSIHFSAILRFRLAGFLDFVRECVGKAIEEFKREEDHQTFMDMVRQYIAKKESGVDLVHIVQGENFTFYNDKGDVMTNDMLRMWMFQAPLYALGLHDNEFNLSPLIAMAPAKIKIYGSRPADPKTMTIINIFQERVFFEKEGASQLSRGDS